jgi:hypothetical protein
VFISCAPCSQGIFFIHKEKPDDVLLAIRIVDNEYNVLISKDSIHSSMGIDLNAFHVPHDTVRIYYKFIGEKL